MEWTCEYSVSILCRPKHAVMGLWYTILAVLYGADVVVVVVLISSYQM